MGIRNTRACSLDRDAPAYFFAFIKARPNRIGVSRCNLVRVLGRVLTVRRLDAIEGTPVLDIKPYMVEFGPRGEVHQPSWSTEIMRSYY